MEVVTFFFIAEISRLFYQKKNQSQHQKDQSAIFDRWEGTKFIND